MQETEVSRFLPIVRPSLANRGHLYFRAKGSLFFIHLCDEHVLRDATIGNAIIAFDCPNPFTGSKGMVYIAEGRWGRTHDNNKLQIKQKTSNFKHVFSDSMNWAASSEEFIDYHIAYDLHPTEGVVTVSLCGPNRLYSQVRTFMNTGTQFCIKTDSCTFFGTYVETYTIAYVKIYVNPDFLHSGIHTWECTCVNTSLPHDSFSLASSSMNFLTGSNFVLEYFGVEIYLAAEASQWHCDRSKQSCCRSFRSYSSLGACRPDHGCACASAAGVEPMEWLASEC